MKARTMILIMHLHQLSMRMLGFPLWFYCDGLDFELGDTAGFYKPDVATQLGQWKS